MRMTSKTNNVLWVVLSVFLTWQLSWAAVGGIKGRLSDVATGRALPGANVQLEGTSLGAATGLNGNYIIPDVQVGHYTIKVSYVGYKSRTKKVLLTKNKNLVENFKPEAVGVTSKEVVVTTQASGQNAAINQQLSSNNIVNVVSAARIQSLPDANAAESVGRLPGVSLVRNGGEATQVVIRGLAPQYNLITIDNVPLAPTDAYDRGTDLSMISSSSLAGIQVYKTVTPDMDAAFLGGTVNFDIREAQGTSSGAPLVSLVAQGGYDNLVSQFNDFKLQGSVQQRFFDNRFGIFVQGIVSNRNLSTDNLSSGFYLPDNTRPNILDISNVNLSFSPGEQRLYNGILTMDYRLPNGKIGFWNLFSQGNKDANSYSDSYSIFNYTTYDASRSTNTKNLIQNILRYEQRFSAFKLDASVSNSYTENNWPNNWNVGFTQGSVGTGNFTRINNPEQFARQAAALTNFKTMYLDGIGTSDSFNKHRNIQASIDIQRNFDLSDLISILLKGGGAYTYTTRYYGSSDGGGVLTQPSRAFLLADPNLKFMTQPPWNMNPSGVGQFAIGPFLYSGVKFGDFLNGDYPVIAGTNIGLLGQALNRTIAFAKTLTTSSTGGQTPYLPDVLGNIASNYAGHEDRSAGYIMATVNVGPQVSLISGVRYQGLLTSYTAAHFLNASAPNPYPNPLPYTEVTKNEYHGYWLPDVILKYEPFSWLNIHAAYTNTIHYPDFGSIIPIMDVYSSNITWNNYALKPATSHNYDLEVSLYDNTIGLLSVAPYLKRIDNLIFSWGGT